jgi:hypothetical protein
MRVCRGSGRGRHACCGQCQQRKGRGAAGRPAIIPLICMPQPANKRNAAALSLSSHIAVLSSSTHHHPWSLTRTLIDLLTHVTLAHASPGPQPAVVVHLTSHIYASYIDRPVMCV